jgi:glycosyltransferase involved in cell wall biosynthesis
MGGLIMNAPTISVIMLTYNRENMVSHMIECILNQTFKDFQFVIVNNGSSDRSGEIAEEYAKKDSRIKVVHLTTGNISRGRNVGLDNATGKYIAFVDDDDECDEDFLEFLYNLIKENDADVAICGSTTKDINEKKIMNNEEAIETLLWRKNYNVAFPTKLIKKELFNKNRFLETTKYDDIYLAPIILAEAKTIAYHGKSKYNFYRHQNNNSAWTQNHKLLDKATLKEYLEVYKNRTSYLCEKFPTKKSTWEYFNWSFMISMVEKVIRLELPDCEEELEYMKKELITNKEKFLSYPEILDFEVEWVKEYIS